MLCRGSAVHLRSPMSQSETRNPHWPSQAVDEGAFAATCLGHIHDRLQCAWEMAARTPRRWCLSRRFSWRCDPQRSQAQQRPMRKHIECDCCVQSCQAQSPPRAGSASRPRGLIEYSRSGIRICAICELFVTERPTRSSYRLWRRSCVVCSPNDGDCGVEARIKRLNELLVHPQLRSRIQAPDLLEANAKCLHTPKNPYAA